MAVAGILVVMVIWAGMVVLVIKTALMVLVEMGMVSDLGDMVAEINIL